MHDGVEPTIGLFTQQLNIYRWNGILTMALVG